MDNREEFEKWYADIFCKSEFLAAKNLKKNQAEQYVDWGICKIYLAWQEQQKKIDELKAENKRLKADIEMLIDTGEQKNGN